MSKIDNIIISKEVLNNSPLIKKKFYGSNLSVHQ